jgi:hypothetical protein
MLESTIVRVGVTCFHGEPKNERLALYENKPNIVILAKVYINRKNWFTPTSTSPLLAIPQ